jgi:hypothetical protein
MTINQLAELQSKRQMAQQIQNRVVADGHMNKALDDIMRVGGSIGGPDAIFNIIGDLTQKAIYTALGLELPDKDAELKAAFDEIFNRRASRDIEAMNTFMSDISKLNPKDHDAN